MTDEQTDVLIVGGGPAGLAAALELKRLGVGQVIVVEREAELGGIPRLCHHIGFGLRDLHWPCTGPAYAREYVRRAERAGVDMRPLTTATGWNGSSTITFTGPSGLGQIHARAILLATGCRERPRAARLVPGSRPQGVFTTGSLQRFVHEHHLPVGRRAVIVGAELISLSALLTLRSAGVSVAAMITEQLRHQISFAFLIADLLTRTPLLTQTRLVRIVGEKRVEGVEIARVGSNSIKTLSCDTVVFTGDWIPEHELARLGGLELDPTTRGVRVDNCFRTSAPGVFATGNLLRGAEPADVCALEGRRAARHIAAFLR